ncbi:MAG: calcium/sodium antiporter [bacterium]|jgi:cation:H+ antiporter|nr:calcium/sodium antiporter [bacterium]
MSILYILLGGTLLYFGGDWLVSGATQLAKRFGVSPLVIGLTIVALGTSCPELAAMLIAALKGQPEIAVGAIIGSNISNIALILGLSALICPLTARLAFLKREVPIMIFTAALFFPLAWLGYAGRAEGAIFVFLLIVYIWYTYTKGKEETTPDDYTAEIENLAPSSLSWSIFLVIAGIAFLTKGADFLIEGAVLIATYFGIPEKVVGLTLVALGTSLPELASCIVAALRKETDIILGNIIGSNIFNILGIMGTTALIRPFEISMASVWIDLLVMMAVTLLLFPFLYRRLCLGRREGAFLVTFYIAYVGYLYTAL